MTPCIELHAHCSPHNTEDYCFTRGCYHTGNITVTSSPDLPAHMIRLYAFGHEYSIRIKDLPDPLTLDSVTQFATALHKNVHKNQ